MKTVLTCLFIVIFTLVCAQPGGPSRFCKIPCRAGTQCVNGLCMKIGMPLSSIEASQQSFSKTGSSTCPQRASCQFGYCLPQKCSPCPKGSSCMSISSCPKGFVCVGNQCQRDCQKKCPLGGICLNDSSCERIPSTVQKC